ncbi:MAG: TrkA family potassium uptake protein, partial [Clostridia bacterium]|nr:TrkA family potassium uptake protein [Clostridia bacterium]
MKSVLIIGAGQFGTHVAKVMNDLRCEIMAVDIDESSVNAILPFVTNAQIGDGTNKDFLQSLGVRNYDVCIVSIGDNFQSSLEATALLKEMGAALVIS